MSTLYVRATQQCDIRSKALASEGTRFGKKALFPGQFYELPGDSQGLAIRGQGEAARFKVATLKEVGVEVFKDEDAYTDAMAEQIAEATRAKRARANGEVMTAVQASAHKKAQGMLKKGATE